MFHRFFLLFIFLIGILCLSFLFSNSVHAVTSTVGEEILKQTVGFSGPGGANLPTPYDPRETAGLVVYSMLGLLGTALLGYLIYGGYLIMTAAGNEDRTKKGRDVITNSIIGLLIILSAYSIAIFVQKIVLHKGPEDGVCVEEDVSQNLNPPLYEEGVNDWFQVEGLPPCPK